jgi:hypothetical protein
LDPIHHHISVGSHPPGCIHNTQERAERHEQKRLAKQVKREAKEAKKEAKEAKEDATAQLNAEMSGEVIPLIAESADVVRPMSKGEAMSRGGTRPVSKGLGRPVSRGGSRPASRGGDPGGRPVSRGSGGGGGRGAESREKRVDGTSQVPDILVIGSPEMGA